MKKTTLHFVLFIIFMVLLPLLAEAEAIEEIMFDLTKGKPIGEEHVINYSVENELSQDYDTAEIYSYKYQELDNYSFRFTIEYSLPEGLDIYIFGGSKIQMTGKGKTHSNRNIFQFDISSKDLFRAKQLVIKFNKSDKNRFFVNFKLDNNDFEPLEPDPFELTDGTLIGEEHDLNYSINNELNDGYDQATIHRYKYQKLDNDFIRFSIEYTMPEGMKISVYNPNGRIVKLLGKKLTSSGRNIQQFDLRKDAIMQSNVIVCEFSSNDIGSYSVPFRTDENSIFIDLEELATGNPIGKEQKVKYEINNKLKANKNRAKIHRYVSQEYDNGYVLYTIEYTMPEGLEITAYDSLTEGTTIKLYSNAVTSSEKSTFQYCVKKKDIIALQGFVVSFYANDDNKLFVWFPYK